MGGQSVVGGLVQGTWYKPPNYSNTIYIAHMKQMKSNESLRCFITFQHIPVGMFAPLIALSMAVEMGDDVGLMWMEITARNV